MGKSRDEKSEATNRRISSSTECNSKQALEKSNERSEWLPDGWNVDFRIRKSGANMGYGYKCYIDPSGHKFYSKLEVLRYLETVNSNNNTSKKEKICKSNDAVEKSTVEDFPPGQITEVKIRKGSNGSRVDSDAVEKSPVEDLPPGWITEAKARKGGTGNRKDMFYIDPASGYVFRSKKDALRYVKSGDISTCVLKPYKRQIQDEDKITDAIEKSTIEDLPPDQITEVKIRKGDNGNRVEDSPPGQIIEVKIRKGGNGNRIDLDVAEKSPAKDLPPGWITEAKVRKGGTGNKKDMLYIDPVSGYVFRSKKDALRYVKSGDISSCVLKPYKRQIQVEDKIIDAIENSYVEDLPPGQITEVKIRKGSNGKRDVIDKSPVEDLPPGWITKVKARKGGTGNRKDMLYIDPVSEYVFRSKKDALRYVNSGDISSCVLNPYKRKIQVEDKITPSSTRKKQKLKQSATKRLFVGQEIYNESTLELPEANDSKKGQDLTDSYETMVAPVLMGEPVIKNQSLKNAAALTPEMKKISDSDDVQKKNRVVNILEHAFKKNHSNPSLSKTKGSNSNGTRRRFSRRLSGAEPDQLANVANEQALQVPKRNLRNSVSVSDTDLINKSSQQLNGVLEIEHLHKKQGEVQMNTNKSSDKKEQQILCRASKRLAGFEPELRSNSISNRRAPNYKSKKSKGDVNASLQQSGGQPAMELAGHHASINGESSNKDRKLPETTPITINQLKKLDDDEINNDEKSEPEQSFAFHYSCSDPCLEFAIQTLTGALPVEDSVDNVHARISETDISPKIKLAENVTGSSSDKNLRVNSKKFKNKKELTIPRRLSKRLAGHEPEVLPTEKAIEYATSNLCNEKPAATAILTIGVSEHLHSREEPKLVVQESNMLKTLCGESSSKTEKSYDPQTVPNGQLQRLEAENVDDDRSDPQFPTPFGDTWSDPCQEFAVESLSGALPDDAPIATAAAGGIFPVMTLDINDPPNNELHDNPNQSQTKKEFSTVCQSPKQILDQPELTTNSNVSTCCRNDPKFAAKESYKDEDSITRNFNERIEARNAREIDINKTILEEEPQQPEIINHDNFERAFSVPFMDSWSDPCLEFAFKTLTGTTPVEENIAIQRSFQEPANHHDQRGGGSMVQEFGFSSISHSGISFHNDIGQKAKPGQQSSTSSSLLPQEKEKPSLHGFSGVAPQQQYFQYSNNNFQTR